MLDLIENLSVCPIFFLQELAALSEKCSIDAASNKTKVKSLESALEERKVALELLETARDDLQKSLKHLELKIKEQELKIEVRTRGSI